MYIDTSASTRICLNAANADTATKLAEPKTIEITGAVTGSVQFDGSADANIVTEKNHTHLVNEITDLDTYAVPKTRKVNGKALSSDITLTYSDVGAAAESHTHLYAGSDSAGGPANSVKDTYTTGADKLDKITFSSALYNDYVSDYDNGYVNIAFWEDGTGCICKGGSEYLSVNHSTTSDEATKLTTAHTLTIGNSGKTFDGSADVSWTLSEIGAAAASHSHSYLPLSGGTLTGNLIVQGTINSSNRIGSIGFDATDANGLRIAQASSTNTKSVLLRNDGNYFWTLCCDSTGGWYTPTGGDNPSRMDLTTGYTYFSKVYGAVWNDFAEFRISDCLEPGRVVCENGDDTLLIATKRLQPGANIISDTYGFAIGETDEAKCPIAVSGRVLAYGYEDRDEFKLNIGRPVCAGPNGTVSIMTNDEYKNYGYCAIGTISAVPDYEEWGTGKIKVNNRIWIKVV